MWLFLDIDGVMVPAKGWKSPELLPDGFPVFSHKAVIALNNLITEDTTVFLTTSHKSSYSIVEWKEIFESRGIKINRIERLPTNVNNLNRKDELLAWFNVNAIVDDFIIIDDDKSLNGLPDFLKKSLVQTSPYIGLTDEHVELVKSKIELQQTSLLNS